MNEHNVLQANDHIKYKHKLGFKGATLLWFGLFFILAIAGAFLMAFYGPDVVNYVYTLSLYTQIFIIAGSLATLFIIAMITMIFGYKFKWWLLLIFASILSLFVGGIVMLIAFAGLAIANDNTIDISVAWKFTVLLFIPASAFIFSGVLSSINRLNEKFIYVLISISFFALLISITVGFFIRRNWLDVLILSIAFILMYLYIIIDMYYIHKLSKHFKNPDNADKKEFLRLSIFFGFRLFYDYMVALYYAFRLYSYIKG